MTSTLGLGCHGMGTARIISGDSHSDCVRVVGGELDGSSGSGLPSRPRTFPAAGGAWNDWVQYPGSFPARVDALQYPAAGAPMTAAHVLHGVIWHDFAVHPATPHLAHFG